MNKYLLNKWENNGSLNTTIGHLKDFEVTCSLGLFYLYNFLPSPGNCFHFLKIKKKNYLLAAPNGINYLSSLTRDWTCCPLHLKSKVLTTGPSGESCPSWSSTGGCTYAAESSFPWLWLSPSISPPQWWVLAEFVMVISRASGDFWGFIYALHFPVIFTGVLCRNSSSSIVVCTETWCGRHLEKVDSNFSWTCFYLTQLGTQGHQTYFSN